MSYEVFPKADEINRFKVSLTEGEKLLLMHLKQLFSSSKFLQRTFEIHVQPNLFFGKPDFIVIEPENSVWIIEVKDYNPNSYNIYIKNDKDFWNLKDTTYIPSPISQVQDYKDKLLKYAGPSLYKTFKKDEYFRIKFAMRIRIGVFFPFFDHEKLSHKINHTFIFTKDSLQKNNGLTDWHEFFKPIYKDEIKMGNKSYKEIRSIINPGENGRNRPLPEFIGKYKTLAESKPVHQKMKGIAGTGKTSVLAKRVIDCSRRLRKESGEILVTYYNITMGNYIRDKIISEGNGKTLNELGVQIVHYHSLYNWDNNFNIIGKKSDKIFKAIFVDEGQDFKSDWFVRIKEDYLSKKLSEFVIFADQHQNIYDQDTDLDQDENMINQRLPVTPILGRWKVLNTVFRTKNNLIYSLLNSYTREMLRNETENLDTQLSLFLEKEHESIFYKDLTNQELEGKLLLESIENHLDKLVSEKEIPINDIAILADNRFFLKKLEFALRVKGGLFSENQTTFKPANSLEEFKRKRNLEIEKEENKPYKMRFYRNGGSIKFSTIHSFKGWETPYVILILFDKPTNNDGIISARDYLVYTGLSRAQKGLFVLNRDQNYSEFMEKHFTVL